MPGFACADHLIMRRIRLAASVTGRSPDDPFNVFKDSLNAPEAASGKDRRLLAPGVSERGINKRVWKGHTGSGRIAAQCGDNANDGKNPRQRIRHTHNLSTASSVQYKQYSKFVF